MNIFYPDGLPISMSLVGYNALLTSLFVLFKRRDRIGIYYLLTNIFISGWAVGLSFQLNNYLPLEQAYFWGRIAQASAATIPATWFHFVAVYTGTAARLKNFLVLIYIITITIVSFSFTDWFVPGFRKMMGINYPIPGPLYVVHTLLFICVVTYSFLILYSAWGKETNIEKRHDFKFLFFAQLFGFGVGSLSLLPVYGIDFPQINLLIMPLWQFLLAYALVRYNLMDVEQVIQAFQREKLATIGLLAASVNHEIRNPLYAIKGLLETYLENEKEGIQKKTPKEISEKALAQVTRALEVIGKLNRFAKPASEKADQIASIPDAVQTVLDLVAYEFELDKIHIKNEVEKNIPKIQADQRQLEEILFNLIVNACQAMNQGGELIIASEPKHASDRHREASEAGRGDLSASRLLRRPFGTPRNDEVIQITISDTGTGISQEQAKHLFEPFHTTKGEKGTGLGLYITKQIIEQSGGRITVKSQEGKGTTFYLEFNAL